MNYYSNLNISLLNENLLIVQNDIRPPNLEVGESNHCNASKISLIPR